MPIPDLAQALTAIAALLAGGAGFAAVLSFYRRRPGEKQTEVINVGRATIEIAEGSVNIAKSAADMQREIAEQLERRMEIMSGELEMQRGLIDKLRDRSDALAEDLRTVKGKLITAVERLEVITTQRDALMRATDEKDAEIKRLRDRVQHLEDRVARFEA